MAERGGAIVVLFSATFCYFGVVGHTIVKFLFLLLLSLLHHLYTEKTLHFPLYTKFLLEKNLGVFFKGFLYKKNGTRG